METITKQELVSGFNFKSEYVKCDGTKRTDLYTITKIDDKMVYYTRTNAPKRFGRTGKVLCDRGMRLGIEKFLSEFEQRYTRN